MYDVKVWQELAWGVLIALIVYAAQVMASFEVVTDWRAWAISVGVGAVRIIGGTLLSLIPKRDPIEPQRPKR